ncbi:MAG TPA: MMPL family transporter [Streptosporangiaceae bacterium]|nr:MMPL family transporter [Streptosporangiaceae bacterium]
MPVTADSEAPGRARAAVGWFWRMTAALIVALRVPILLGWIAAAVLATLYLPAISSSGSIGGLVSANSPAVRAEVDAARLFGEPLASAGVEVVQRDPGRFPARVEVASGRPAIAVDEGRVAGIRGLAGALPVANAGGFLPWARERSTTIITYLFFRPGTTVAAQTAGGQAYAHRFLRARAYHLVGVTGAVPAENAQTGIIQGYLPWVEVGTVLAIGVIVAMYFRSAGAALASLACSAVAYLVAIRLVGWIIGRTGLTVPPDLKPVLVVLLLGVTTDYAVFFLAGMRARVADGLGRLPAARRTTAEFLPIIVTAGFVVSAGIASLAVARISELQAFGPALALTVLIAMAVAVTLTPAIIAIFGGLLFRRARPDRGPGAAPSAGRDRIGRMVTTRPVAALAAAACVAGLALGAADLPRIRLGFPLIKALPAGQQAVRAQDAAARGFVPGILSPTEILLIGPGVTRQQAALARLQRALGSGPGVADVLGPASYPGVQQSLDPHLMLARSGGAARYVLIQRTDPLGPAAIGQVSRLTAGLPSLARAAGLTRVRFEVGGETALAGQAIRSTASDLWRIALIIGVVITILVALFLRAVVAPFYLLAASVLALLAALGLTVWIFQGLLGDDGLVYYVPFAVAVLLISLGSDYNIFVVGRIWEEARRRPLRDAVAAAVPRASRAITTAALALAAGFAMLALVPLAQFRELAAAMVLGILIDAFVVRSVLVPALVVLFGEAGRWPGGRRAAAPAAARDDRIRHAPSPARSQPPAR